MFVVGGDDIRMVDEHRARWRLEERKCSSKNIVLELCVTGLAERAAQRELAVQGARWRNLDGHLTNRRQHDRRDSCSFEHVGEHTHGARTQRSNRSQDHDVDTVGEQHGRRCGSGVEPDRRDVVGLVASE